MDPHPDESELLKSSFKDDADTQIMKQYVNLSKQGKNDPLDKLIHAN